MRICYNFPSRERPGKFFDCLNNIAAYSEGDNYFVLAKLDYDDPLLDEYISATKDCHAHTVVIGYSKNKVHAINRDLSDLPPFDILCTHSDDMWFISPGFDNDIRDAAKKFSGLIHFPDQVAKERLCTYSIMTSDYYRQLGYVYHPDFMNVYCDNFQVIQAQKLNKYKFINKNILEHRHPVWGFGEPDALLRRTESPDGYKKDYETLLRLKNENGW
jgi:hypothetical protein